MSNVPSSAALSNAVITLLADAAFVFAEPTTASMPAGENSLVARLTMELGERWELCVCVEEKLGQLLAANLLGTESETGEAQAAASDAVGELANILSGTLALNLFGKTVVCKIGIPVVAMESGRAVDDCLAKSACRVNLETEEGYVLAVALIALGES
ncbi:MAG TPA: chemotaxis protein CheX [Polyangia bacterium]